MFKNKDPYELRLKKLECRFEAWSEHDDERTERLHKDFNDRIDMLVRCGVDPEYKEYLRLKDKFESS